MLETIALEARRAHCGEFCTGLSTVLVEGEDPPDSGQSEEGTGGLGDPERRVHHRPITDAT